MPEQTETKEKQAQVRVIITPSPAKPKMVHGKVGTRQCSMLLDRGASLSTYNLY